MSKQITKVDLIPNGEISVCNVSQFDNGRVLPFEILENKEAYNIPNDIRVELHCRKADGNIVTLPSENITNNIVTFLSTTQLTACYGRNVCEIALYGPDDYLIGSGNFILEVEKSPTLGGINSTSVIHDLEDQIEEITTEIIGENYYNKTEIDDLLDSKADASSVYTKSQTDTLLSAKANSSDVYTKGQIDTALAAKADASTTTAALATKADKSDTYTKEQVDALIDSIFPTFTASGTVATFTTALTQPLVSVTAAAGANTVTACGVNLFDKTEVMNGYIIDSTGEYRISDNRKCTDFLPIKGGENYRIITEQTDSAWGAWYDKDKHYISACAGYYVGGTVKTAPENACFVRLTICSAISGNVDTFGLNYPSTDTTYHTYNGQTVAKADATTLTTQSGVNNVFADSGEVTVQYKYMSI